ncbi:Recombinase zinc beta ribbon domain-containing protein [Rhodococcoides kroppenstedtii]|uniref:Recombinase zinc beta ribbon domain-containing protein n=2 Tax=Rhodococcoides kroppenstedtii TaxID=293050 RepID=A0A1I0SP72_9NOCA|nr:Recombinase zinc beta ribbon domain-containing protein [Rhodococcus kroppenstedtii]
MGEQPGRVERAVSLVLDNGSRLQAPAVEKYVWRLRRAHPEESPEQIVARLEKMFLTAVTSSGGAAGATAAIPGVGTVASIAAIGGETAFFLEAAALLTLSVASVHGISVTDHERRKALVLAVALGDSGKEIVQRSLGRTGNVGKMLSAGIPGGANLSGLNKRLISSFVKKVYEDNSVSAYKSKVRPEWAALLNDLRSGERDGLICYDLDRLARQPRDLEDLIDVIDRRKVPNKVVTGEVNLSTGDGIFMARTLVNVANKASRDTARRVARKAQERAEQGLPQQGRSRPFGYDRAYNVIESEAKMIREAYRRVVAGESLTSILYDWQDTPTVSGGKWHRATLRAILRNPRNAGLRFYRGREIGVGTWEAIVPRDLWEAAQERLTANPSKPVDTTNKYLLTGIARCGHCGAKMYGRAASKRRKAHYACMRNLGGCGRLVRQMGPVDDFVSALVKAHISRAEPPEDVGPDYSGEIAALERRIAELRQAWNDGALSLPDFIPMRDAEDAKIKALQRKKAQVSATETIGSFSEGFDSANLSQKRAIIMRFLTAVLIKPTNGAPARRVDLSLIEPIWKQADRS